ncbi:MAG: response regulator [Rhodospirillaceae bacterium]
MKKFDKDKLAELDIYLGEPNEQVREGLRAMLRSEGLRRTRTFTRMDDLMNAMKERSPDLLIVADDMDPEIFQIVKDIRHHRIGRNPFIVISFMVNAEEDRAIKKAILAGADDVMIKPVAPGRLLERVSQLGTKRLPFIATTDYVGPERRRGDGSRPSKIRQLKVINTLQAKLEGKRVSSVDLARGVEHCMNEVMAAKLDSHGLRLGYVCNLILKAYDEKNVTKEVEENLIVLVTVLEDAAKTAKGVGEAELSAICVDLARQVEELAEKYEEPSASELALIRKLTKAFELAKGNSNVPPAPKPAPEPAQSGTSGGPTSPAPSAQKKAEPPENPGTGSGEGPGSKRAAAQ